MNFIFKYCALKRWGWLDEDLVKDDFKLSFDGKKRKKKIFFFWIWLFALFFFFLLVNSSKRNIILQERTIRKRLLSLFFLLYFLYFSFNYFVLFSFFFWNSWSQIFIKFFFFFFDFFCFIHFENNIIQIHFTLLSFINLLFQKLKWFQSSLDMWYEHYLLIECFDFANLLII